MKQIKLSALKIYYEIFSQINKYFGRTILLSNSQVLFKTSYLALARLQQKLTILLAKPNKSYFSTWVHSSPLLFIVSAQTLWKIPIKLAWVISKFNRIQVNWHITTFLNINRGLHSKLRNINSAENVHSKLIIPNNDFLNSPPHATNAIYVWFLFLVK